MNDSPKDIIRFILTSKYFLKQRGVRPSKWRAHIAKDFVLSGNVGRSDDFCRTWDELEKRGLLK